MIELEIKLRLTAGVAAPSPLMQVKRLIGKGPLRQTSEPTVEQEDYGPGYMDSFGPLGFLPLCMAEQQNYSSFLLWNSSSFSSVGQGSCGLLPVSLHRELSLK